MIEIASISAAVVAVLALLGVILLTLSVLALKGEVRELKAGLERASRRGEELVKPSSDLLLDPTARVRENPGTSTPRFGAESRRPDPRNWPETQPQRGDEQRSFPQSMFDEAAPPEPRRPLYPTISRHEPGMSDLSTEPLEPTPSPHVPRADPAKISADYNRAVIVRAGDGFDFASHYRVISLEPTTDVGGFRQASDQQRDFLWAVEVSPNEYELFPGKEMVRKWPFMAAMKGSGANEYFNDAFEMAPGAGGLAVLRPARARQDSGSGAFRLLSRGSLTGVED